MSENYWFSHDFNAKDDPKIMLLMDELGMEGYGIYWVLIETLRGCPEAQYRYPLRLIPSLARKYATTSPKVETVIRNYGLFIIENKEFFLSKSLCKRMEKYDFKREQMRINARIGVEKRKKELQESEQKLLANLSQYGSSEQLHNSCSAIDEQKEKKKRKKEIPILDIRENEDNVVVTYPRYWTTSKPSSSTP